jgi:hypothetical protein
VVSVASLTVVVVGGGVVVPVTTVGAVEVGGEVGGGTVVGEALPNDWSRA